MNTKSIFEIYFDISKSRWTPWMYSTIDEAAPISGEFISNAIENEEIIRLNPLAVNVI